jgi:hypothetical protein
MFDLYIISIVQNYYYIIFNFGLWFMLYLYPNPSFFHNATKKRKK